MIAVLSNSGSGLSHEIVLDNSCPAVGFAVSGYVLLKFEESKSLQVPCSFINGDIGYRITCPNQSVIELDSTAINLGHADYVYKSVPIRPGQEVRIPFFIWRHRGEFILGESGQYELTIHLDWAGISLDLASQFSVHSSSGFDLFGKVIDGTGWVYSDEYKAFFPWLGFVEIGDDELGSANYCEFYNRVVRLYKTPASLVRFLTYTQYELGKEIGSRTKEFIPYWIKVRSGERIDCAIFDAIDLGFLRYTSGIKTWESDDVVWVVPM